jgi:hypothetical protein
MYSPAQKWLFWSTAPLVPYHTMSNIITFSNKYEGLTFEAVFFKAPWFAQFIIDNRIHRQEHNMDPDEGAYFKELHRRASHLARTCTRCHERPLTRMGLTRHRGSDILQQVGFYCDECEYMGGATTGYYDPSFFVDAYDETWANQKRITKEIKRHYIGDGSLTQAKMEEFFRDDANFVDATPGFLTAGKAVVT